MRISTLTRKWNISEQIIKSFLKEQDNNFDMSADEISENQYESLIMHFGNEIIIDESKGIVCYSLQVNRVTQYYIVRKKDNVFLDVDGNKMFTSLLVGHMTVPTMLTLNQYNTQGGYDRGIVSISEDGLLEVVCPFGKEYDFIDGVDHDLARVRKNNKWGIIGYSPNTEKFVEVLAVEYDSIWNFYEKNINIVNVEKGGKSARLDLRTLNSQTDDLIFPKGITYFSVSNFKRFKDEVSFDLGDINFIVGPNNAGKSTMGKALMLAYYNLMYYVSNPASGSRCPLFYLSPKGYDGLTQESIKSAFCNKQDSDRYMTFTLTANGCKSTMNVYCPENEQSQTFAFIHCWEIEDVQTGVLCKFDFLNEKSSLFAAEEEIYSYKQKDFWNAYTSDNSESRLIVSLVDSFKKILNEERTTLKTKSERVDVTEEIQRNNNEIVKVNQYLSEKQQKFFKDSFSTLYEKPEFVYSNSGVSRILDSNDNNNHIAQIARDYYCMTKQDVGVENYSKVQIIIKELVDKYLLDYFRIARKIEVEEDEDSYYKIFLTTVDSKKENLANYGRGTIQVVLLLMKMAVTIFHNVKDNTLSQSIVLVEEPEQNMHPNWQSILANWFAKARELTKELSAPRNNALIFVVETHSEYLIRKTQVLVKNSNFEDNPFAVHYCPNSPGLEIRQLQYRKDGKFEDDRMPGFTDVSMSLALKLF